MHIGTGLGTYMGTVYRELRVIIGIHTGILMRLNCSSKQLHISYKRHNKRPTRKPLCSTDNGYKKDIKKG